jgi:arsenate reductase
MTITVYGIPNCQTVKKARDWLDTHEIKYTFHDFKKQGITKDLILLWLKKVDLNQLLNRSGMTYRNLTEQQKLQSQNENDAIALMIQNPSMIKRPVLAISQEIHLGFKDADYVSFFGTTS